MRSQIWTFGKFGTETFVKCEYLVVLEAIAALEEIEDRGLRVGEAARGEEGRTGAARQQESCALASRSLVSLSGV